MDFLLTIDNQPLVLKLEAILALFGKARTMEFAEGKWTPFVFFQVEDEPDSVTVVQRIDFTDMDKSEKARWRASRPTYAIFLVSCGTPSRRLRTRSLPDRQGISATASSASSLGV